MGKRANRRDQTQKDPALSRVHAVQELRRSSAAERIPSGRSYDRNDFRRSVQSGNWDIA